MVPADDWDWLGQAGHFICADRCRFHLHTHVGKYCISTVGEFFVNPGDEKPEEIGYKRLYETMVFRLGTDGCPSGLEIEIEAYNDREDANHGHWIMCESYSDTEETTND